MVWGFDPSKKGLRQWTNVFEWKPKPGVAVPIFIPDTVTSIVVAGRTVQDDLPSTPMLAELQAPYQQVDIPLQFEALGSLALTVRPADHAMGDLGLAATTSTGGDAWREKLGSRTAWYALSESATPTWTVPAGEYELRFRTGSAESALRRVTVFAGARTPLEVEIPSPPR
jgi:hypothetical protein